MRTGSRCWKRHLASVFLAAALVSGASFSSALPAGAATVTDAQYGFSFALPAGWMRVPLNSKAVGAMLDAAAKNDPSLKNIMNQQVNSAIEKGVKVFAMGPISQSFIPNLNVSLEPVPAGMGQYFMSLMPAGLKIVLKSVGAKDITVSSVKVPFGQALRATYQMPLKTAFGGLTVHGLQYYVLHGTNAYITTFTASTAGQDSAAASVVEHSWHWGSNGASVIA